MILFDYIEIKKKSENFIVFQSDNDPYVGLGDGKELAKNLGVDFDFIPGAGHFNKAAGYEKFDALLEKLLMVLEK